MLCHLLDYIIRPNDLRRRLKSAEPRKELWADDHICPYCKVIFSIRDYDSSTYSIVNHLMRRYQVDVPLRTQGWINDKLISVTIENGKCEHLRYMRSKGAQCSQKIFDCMHELILKVCLETEG